MVFINNPAKPAGSSGSTPADSQMVFSAPVPSQAALKQAGYKPGDVVTSTTALNNKGGTTTRYSGGSGSIVPAENIGTVQSYQSTPAVITAQQKLDQAANKFNTTTDTYGKSNLYGAAAVMAFQDINKNNPNRFQQGYGTAGDKPLTYEEKIIQAQQLGYGGYPIRGVEGRSSPTVTGKGTTFNTPDIKNATKYDLANSISVNAQVQTEKVIGQEQTRVLNEVTPKYQNQLTNIQDSLQNQVNRGQLTVKQANDNLKQYTETINQQFVAEVNNKVINNVSPQIQIINTQAIQTAGRNGVSTAELERRVGKFEARTGLKPEDTRLLLETGAVVAASAIAGPAGGEFVGGLIGGKYLLDTAKAMKENTPILDIKKDKYGNISVVQVGENVNPQVYKSGLNTLFFAAPAVGEAIARTAADITIERAVQEVSKKIIKLEDLNRGFVTTEVKDFTTGKIVTQEIPIRVGTSPLIDATTNVDKLIKNGITYGQLVKENKLGIGNIPPSYNPIKIEDLNIQVRQGSQVPYGPSPYATNKILGIELPYGRSIVLGGKTAEGKIYLGSPNLLKQLYKLPTTTEIKLSTALQTEVLYKNLLAAGIESTPRAKLLIPEFKSLIRKTLNTQSKYINEKELYSQTQYLPEKGVNVFLDLAKENKGVLFGSKARAYQLMQEYNIDGKTFKLTKVPRDVEVRFDQVAENDLQKLTDKSVAQLKKLGVIQEGGTKFELNTAREIKGTPFAIEAKVNGTFEKVAELKGGGGLLEEEQVSNFVVGFNKEGKPIYSSKGIPTTALNEELRGVSQGVLRVRNVKTPQIGDITINNLSKATINNPSAGNKLKVMLEPPRTTIQLDIFPSPKRTKDIGSVVVTARTLRASGAKVGKEIGVIESLFPENLIKEQVAEVMKNPPRPTIASFTASKTTSKNIKINSLYKSTSYSPSTSKEKSPSYSINKINYNVLSSTSLSRSLVKSISASALSKSVTKSTSVSISKSLSKSISASLSSLSPSEIKSPSISASVSKSVSPSISPYRFKSPSTNRIFEPFNIPIIPPTGRNSLSLGESTRINPNYGFQNKKGAYTASLGSALFGITKKVKAKDLQRTLAKLSSRTYSGFEQRPTIEVIPNTPAKKFNYKKAYKSVNYS